MTPGPPLPPHSNGQSKGTFTIKKKIKCKVYISFGIAFQRLTQNQISLLQAVKKKFFFKSTLCVNWSSHPDQSSHGQLGLPLINKIWAKEGNFHFK